MVFLLPDSFSLTHSPQLILPDSYSLTPTPRLLLPDSYSPTPYYPTSTQTPTLGPQSVELGANLLRKWAESEMLVYYVFKRFHLIMLSCFII